MTFKYSCQSFPKASISSQQAISNRKAVNKIQLIFLFDLSDPKAPQAKKVWMETTMFTLTRFAEFLDNAAKYIKDLKWDNQIGF